MLLHYRLVGHLARQRTLVFRLYPPFVSDIDDLLTRLYRILDTSQLLRDQLKWLTTSYPTPGGIYISEFGFIEPVSSRDTQFNYDQPLIILIQSMRIFELNCIKSRGMNAAQTICWTTSMRLCLQYMASSLLLLPV